MTNPRILGLQADQKNGILKALNVSFKEDRVIAIKGENGSGKSTFMDMLKHSVIGAKATSHDYKASSFVTSVKDGSYNIFLGKRDGDPVFFAIDDEGNKVDKIVVEGVKVDTALKWQKMLYTELTWNFSGLMSPDRITHRDTIQKIFQHSLKGSGVVFDKKHKDYKGSILHKISEAEELRTGLDVIRKQVGGLVDSIKQNYGIDMDKLKSIPTKEPLDKIDKEIAELNQQLGNVDASYKQKIAELKNVAHEINDEALSFNRSIAVKNENFEQKRDKLSVVHELLKELGVAGYFEGIKATINIPDNEQEIIFIDDKISDYFGDDKIALSIIEKRAKLANDYRVLMNTNDTEDRKKLVENNIADAEDRKKLIIEDHRKVDAIKSCRDWQESHSQVLALKQKYRDMLTQIDTGVKGMFIEDIDGDICLTYNGAHDTAYFRNDNKESRKLNDYSGTQKVLICMLLQSALLAKKERALRYIFIDDVPIDKKSQSFISEMAEKLNLYIFVNIAGDFEAKNLGDGEMLIQDGSVIGG